MSEYTETLSFADISRILGADEAEMPEVCRDLYSAGNFKYRKLSSEESEKLMSDTREEIDSGKFNVAGKEKKPKWDAGWNENWEEFVKSDYLLDSLMPKYVRPVKAFRLNGGYVEPEDSNIEFNLRSILKYFLFRKYLKDANPIYEFGCGPAINLIPLAKMFPQKTFHGLDWVPAPKKIIDELGKRYGWNMYGHVFDMFAPDKNLKLEPTSGILLFSALEQLGNNFEIFLDYLLEQKPAIVVHIDSLQELYNRENPFDDIAYRFAEKRNYLNGYVTKIKELEQKGEIEILKLQRVGFGHMHYIDAYSYDAWKPI